MLLTRTLSAAAAAGCCPASSVVIDTDEKMYYLAPPSATECSRWAEALASACRAVRSSIMSAGKGLLRAAGELLHPSCAPESQRCSPHLSCVCVCVCSPWVNHLPNPSWSSVSQARCAHATGVSTHDGSYNHSHNRHHSSCFRGPSGSRNCITGSVDCCTRGCR